MIRNDLLLVVVVLIGINTNLSSQEDKCHNSREIDSICKYFSEKQINELNAIEEEFTDFVVGGKNDIYKSYKDYFKRLIKQLNKYGYYSCDVNIMVELSKLNLISKLDPSTYDEIYHKATTAHISSSDSLVVMFDAVNDNGSWVEFLNYYSTIDSNRKDYVKLMREWGDYGVLVDILEFFYKKLGFLQPN